MKETIIINGKFLLAKLEGMPRVGREITAAFDQLLEHDRYANVSIVVATPKGGKSQANYINIPIVEVGNFQGPLWEQIDFPLYVKNGYCLNFTGTGPIIKSNGCVVVHDAQFRSTSKSHTLKTFLLYNIVTTIASNRFKTIITDSVYAQNEIINYKVTERKDIHIIHLGVDHVLRHAPDLTVLQKYSLEPYKYALSNSYAYVHKNVKTLLEAFASMAPDRLLVLFGSHTRKDFDARGILVPDNIKFIGRISDEDLISLMSYAKLFLFPSTTEGFGLPPLEAMRLGCPTVCARAGAMPETCGDGVVYVDPYAANEWANTINFIWDNANEQRRLSAAGLSVAQLYNWSDVAERYLELILAQMKSKRPVVVV